MPTYIAFGDWTDQGARAIRESPQRPDGHVGRGQGDAADAPGASQRRLHGVGPERHFRPLSP